MLPRIKSIFCIFLFFFLFDYSWAEQSSPFLPHPFIRFYKTVISPIDGDRCPMYPSCSQYAEEVFHKHGFLTGWIMTCDRLLRCGGDEDHFSDRIRIKERLLVHDPVEGNDFWWKEQLP